MKPDDEPYRKRDDMTVKEYSARVNYWRELFREAEFEELDDVFTRFYESCNIYLKPLHVANDDGTFRDVLLKNRDRMLCPIIRKKHQSGDMLVVAFWDARFSFHMALQHRFNVTGIEPYKRAVEVANISKDELLYEDRKLLKFQYGFAEVLDEHPDYDVIVNFCLEHVRNPKHVVKEALSHLKPDGCAYFVPPVKHCLGSAEHLQWFDTEKDLESLVPIGYTVNISRVKFTMNAPIKNCFVMEVFK